MSKDELIDKFSHDFRNVTLSERGLRSLLKAFMGELEERYVLLSHVRYNMLRGLEQKWEYKKDETSEDRRGERLGKFPSIYPCVQNAVSKRS